MVNNISYWHEWPSNFSGGQNVSGIGSFMQFANASVNNWLGIIILFVVFLTSFLLTKNQSAAKASATSLFITTLIAILLNRMDMIASMWVGVLAGLTTVAIIFVRGEANRGL